MKMMSMDSRKMRRKSQLKGISKACSILKGEAEQVKAMNLNRMLMGMSQSSTLMSSSEEGTLFNFNLQLQCDL